MLIVIYNSDLFFFSSLRGKFRVRRFICTELIEMDASEQAKKVLKEVFFLIGKGRKDQAMIQLEKAINLAKTIQSEYLRPYVLNEIAQAMLKLDKMQEAIQIIHEAINIANEIVFTASRLEILLEIARSLSETSSEIQNVKILHETLEITEKILNNIIDQPHIDIAHQVTVILRNIVKKSRNLSILNEILVLSKKFNDKDYRKMLLRNIAFRLADLCKNTTDISYIKDVLKIVDQIELKNYREKAIVEITRLLTKTATHNRNLEIVQIALKLSEKIPSEYYRSKIRSKLSILKENAKSS